MSKLKNFALIILCLWAEGLLDSPAWADPVNPKTYYSGTNARALALDTYRNRLYVGFNSAVDNLRVFVLDSQGNTTTTVTPYTLGSNTLAMCLDARRNRLYLASNVLASAEEVHIITLDSNGTPTSNDPRDVSSAIAQALVLDAQRNRLYVGFADSTNGLGVITLTTAGNFSSATTYGTSRQVNALALDAARNKLYLGYNNGEVGTCDLDASGDVTSINSVQNAGTANVTSLALNSYYDCLYATASVNVLYTFPLQPDGSGDPGELASAANAYSVTGVPLSLLVDATRQRLYYGLAESGTSDLRWIPLDAGGIPNGTVGSVTADNVGALALDAERRKFYTTASTTNRYYDLDDEAMPFLLINHGATTTTLQDVELHWSLPNAHFVLVDGTSDLVNYQFPVTYTANTVFDEWHSADDGRWCNVASSRANTLTVKARLTGGGGLKTVRIWFKEDAGVSNGGAVSHYREASITLNGDTPTFTPTPSRSPTATHTPTNTPSPTNTFTRTASITASPTLTPSATMTPTRTGTATFTFTPTPTDTVTGSPTGTSTRTATFTPTGSPTASASATPTRTSTFTSTGTPSSTPSISATPTRTFTFTPTITPSRTFTFTATITPSSTATPFVTATPTDTRTQTSTITPTRTATPTITCTLTQTPTLPPTATPTPGVLFFLERNQFRPARETLGLKVGLLDGQSADIRILTLTGRMVKQWRVPPQPGGYVMLRWDGRNQEGEPTASGIYFVVFEAPNYRVVRKVLVIK